MKALGLDIGTTSISAVVYDDACGILESASVKNDSFLPGASWERIQDPERILHITLDLAENLLVKYPDCATISVTGQMHGILYLNKNGQSVSPLYTWQDGRGDLPYDEERSWAQHLSALTGYSVSTGYGLVTHCYNQLHRHIPNHAVTICTISDYIAMVLSGGITPVMDTTNAASLGFFHAEKGSFDPEALKAAGIDPKMLPEVSGGICLGAGKLGIPVYTAIGDNQASFLGATAGQQDAVLVNMGTGGQISVYSPAFLQTDTLETRPFPGGGWLLVGASLCGGRSYALLERFFRETVKMVTCLEVSAYEAMEQALDQHRAVSKPPVAVTTFQGTRKNPAQLGSVTELCEDNFTPVHLIYSIMHGMAQELYSLYQGYLEKTDRVPNILVGSGNGLRKNKHLRKVFEDVFGCSLILSQNEEEAACGAAMYALKHRK